MTASPSGLGKIRESLVALLAEAARISPDAEALVCEGESLTYADYWASVCALAARLRDLGAAGGRVAVILPNGLDICIASFAAQAAGAQLAPLNPMYTAHELRGILEDAAPIVVVHEEEATARLALVLQELRIPNAIAVSPKAPLWRRGLPPPTQAPACDPGSLAMLQYTGGTSGRPKGVDLTHRALAMNVAQREALLPTRLEQDRILAITPLYHSYATAMGLYLAANCRGTLVILPRFRPELALEAIGRQRITLFAGSPPIFNAIMAHEASARADFSSLRLCYSGSAALPAETLKRWEALTGCPICEGYGQTEAGPVLTYNPQLGPRRAGTVGPALPLTEVEIVDVATGTRVLAIGEIGEVRARGPQIMRGYRNRPGETAEALREGWLYTGDIGSLDGEGYLTIRDRKKEMVIVSGFNVYPREVEEALYAHADVLEAAVVGRRDEKRGEALVAFVALKDSAGAQADDLAAHLSTRLTRYKIPGEIRIVPALPKTPVGKIDKKALKETV